MKSGIKWSHLCDTHLPHVSEPDGRVLLAVDVGLVVDHAHQVPVELK